MSSSLSHCHHHSTNKSKIKAENLQGEITIEGGKGLCWLVRSRSSERDCGEGETFHCRWYLERSETARRDKGWLWFLSDRSRTLPLPPWEAAWRGGDWSTSPAPRTVVGLLLDPPLWPNTLSALLLGTLLSSPENPSLSSPHCHPSLQKQERKEASLLIQCLCASFLKNLKRNQGKNAKVVRVWLLLCGSR